MNLPGCIQQLTWTLRMMISTFGMSFSRGKTTVLRGKMFSLRGRNPWENKNVMVYNRPRGPSKYLLKFGILGRVCRVQLPPRIFGSLRFGVSKLLEESTFAMEIGRKLGSQEVGKWHEFLSFQNGKICLHNKNPSNRWHKTNIYPTQVTKCFFSERLL